MDLAEFEREWKIGEAEVRHVDWRRQYRDLVLRIHGAIDQHLPPDPQDPNGFRRAVNGDLIFTSCARVCFDRSLYYVDSDIEEWGSAAWTIIAIVEDEMRWPDRRELVDDGLKFYVVAISLMDLSEWIHIVCRDLEFDVLGPVTDMQMPLRP